MDECAIRDFVIEWDLENCRHELDVSEEGIEELQAVLLKQNKFRWDLYASG